MAGIEKITGHILADAQTEADRIIADGKTRADAVSAEYKEKAERILAKRGAASHDEGDALLARSEASGSNVRRNMLLEAKNEMLDLAFETAAQVFLKMDSEEYLDFMEKLLGSAIEKAALREKASVEAYADEFEPAPVYILRLSAADKARIGDKLEAYGQIVAEKYGKSVELDEKNADIKGGFILRAGDVDTNCSVYDLIEELRPSLESGVYKALFGED